MRRPVCRRRCFDEGGTSLPEMMVTIAVVTILLAVAALGLTRRFVDLEMVQQELINAIRETRLRASVTGARHRLVAMSDRYEIERLEDSDADGVWSVDSSMTPRVVVLPPGMSIAASAVGGGSEVAYFSSRGVLVGDDADVVQYVLSDSEGKTRLVELWPSGQVQADSVVGQM